MPLSQNDRWLMIAGVGIVIALLLIAYGEATGRVDTQQPPRVRFAPAETAP